MRPTTFSTLCAALLLAPFSLNADDRLDQILDELQALRAQVSQLEERVAELEDQPSDSAAIATGAEAEAPPEKRNWFDNMRVELKKAEVRASGAWTEPETWRQLEEGMDEDAAIELLGEPSRRKFSIRKDTDEILIYEGDLHGSGEPVYGEVRIYKGAVNRWEAPKL